MKKIYEIIYAIFLSAFIFSLAVLTAFKFKPLYYVLITPLKIEQNSNLSRDVIIKNYDATIDYLSISGDSKHILTIKQSDVGNRHFRDVKNIIIFIEIVFLISSSIVIFGYFFIKNKKMYNYLKYQAIIMFSTIGFVAVLMGAFFDKMFIIFHKIFFPQGDWQLSSVDDKIIDILPQDFFMIEAFLIALIILSFSLLNIVFYFKNKKLYKYGKNGINIVF